VRLQAARQGAIRRAATLPPRDPRSPAEVQVKRHLEMSQRYLTDGKTADAQAELKAAEQADPTSPAVMLGHARLLVSSKDYAAALAMLDRHDSLATTDEEFNASEQLRIQALYDLKKTKDAALQQAAASLGEGAFPKALEAASAALAADPEDPGLLYYTGVSAAVLRTRRRTGRARRATNSRGTGPA
jgi:thioredoxin-like negative regulator of GroEL